MIRYRALRLLATTMKIVAAIALLATILVVLAVVGGGVNTPPGFPSWLIWTLTLGGTAVVLLTGLTLTVLLYGLGAIVDVLLAIEEHLRVSVGELRSEARHE